MNFGSYLKKTRGNARLSIHELSNFSGVAASTIIAIENSGQKPQIGTVRELQKVLNRTGTDLLDAYVSEPEFKIKVRERKSKYDQKK